MRLAATRDHDAVQLDPVDELLEDRLAARRRDERLVQVAIDVVERLDAKDAALAARVGRLEHRRKPDLVGRPARLGQRAHRREARLRHAGVGEAPAHRDLVRHQVRRLDADPRQPARLGDGGDDRNRTIGAHGEDAVDAAGASSPSEPRRRPRSRPPWRCRPPASPRRVGVAVDGGDAQAHLLRLEDRAALMAAGADEEDGSHGREDATSARARTAGARSCRRRRSGSRTGPLAARPSRRRRSRGSGRPCRATDRCECGRLPAVPCSRSSSRFCASGFNDCQRSRSSGSVRSIRETSRYAPSHSGSSSTMCRTTASCPSSSHSSMIRCWSSCARATKRSSFVGK